MSPAVPKHACSTKRTPQLVWIPRVMVGLRTVTPHTLSRDHPYRDLGDPTDFMGTVSGGTLRPRFLTGA